MSPFSVHAKEHNKRYLGGKHDDITITVAQIFSNRTKIDTYTDPTFPNLVTVYTSSPQTEDRASNLHTKTGGWDEL